MKTKNCNFILLLLYFSFSFSICSFGQLTVEAGKDTTYCIGQYPHTMLLGDHVIIKNGVEPYSIKWECKVELTEFLTYTAKDFLNDTTLLSPLIKGHTPWPEWTKFIIHVRDSKNNYARDSINVRFSTFILSTGYHVVELKRGDSILFNETSVGGGIEPLKFHWQPKTGLSNPDSLVTWCKPDYTTQYDIIAIDSCGCVSPPNTVYNVTVLTTGLDEKKTDKDSLLHIKQVGTTIYFNNPLKLKAHVALYTINGALCCSFDIADDHLKIANQLINKGVYVIRISVGSLTGNSKFINL